MTAGAGAGAMGMGAETDPGAVGLGRMVSMDMRNTEDMVRVHNMEPVAVGVGFLSSILSAAGRRLGNRRRGLLLQLVCCRPSLGPDLWLTDPCAARSSAWGRLHLRSLPRRCCAGGSMLDRLGADLGPQGGYASQQGGRGGGNPYAALGRRY